MAYLLFSNMVYPNNSPVLPLTYKARCFLQLLCCFGGCPEEAVSPSEACAGGGLVTGPVAQWRDVPTLEQVCWSDL